MPDLIKLAQSVVGPFVPFGFMTLVGYGAIRFGRYLDGHLKENTRDAYVDYLRKGGLRDASRSVIDVAADAIDHVFGPRHLSWRCFLRSVAFTIGSIVFFVGLSALMSFSLSLLGYDQFNWFLGVYWSVPFKVPLWGALIWLAWSCMVDYFSLWKTRGLIWVLRRWSVFAPILCIIDFVFGFLLYAFGMSLLSILPMFLQAYKVPPPTVSLETGIVMILIVVIFSKSLLPNLEDVLKVKGLLTPQAIALLHTDAPQTMLAMVFLFQVIPFITIGSDLFYASMMPSIWLWLFLASVFLAKVLALIGWYLQGAFSRFKKKKRTLEVTGALLMPVVLLVIYIATLWPFALTFLAFTSKAFLAVFGALGNHLQSTLPQPPQP